MDEPIEVRVARIEERQDSMNKVIFEIKDNHLAHLNQKVDDLSAQMTLIELKIARWGGGIAVIVIILQILSALYK